jgi:hypothetical protein
LTSQRNLAINGGLLDEVIFAVNTDNEGDLEYLDELIAMSPKYRKHVSGYAEYAQGSWSGSWEPVEHGNIYIKIDDDVVWEFLGFKYARSTNHSSSSSSKTTRLSPLSIAW